MTTKKRIKTVLTLAVVAMAILGLTAASQGAEDVFSVNFYALNGVPAGQEENVTLEPGQSAGFDDWLTTGWENILMPWNPGSPSDPVSITSVEGATATFTLTDVRNGGASQTTAGVRTVPVGDGNGDLLDGAGWGTLDPAWPERTFDMTVSDIPYDFYDVILYTALHPGAGGDGTGVITFNGATTDFTAVIFDGTFTEIVNSGDTGNYIVYKNVSGSSFTVKTWGNGANHVGVCGFQFRQAVPALAADPDPADKATDVCRNVVLSWVPGMCADKHDVYFGTNFDDVNDATTTVDPNNVYKGRQDKDDNSYPVPET
ncbi:MAG: hypothetical protein KAV87_12250, partial [Desulfobacteraceae bacterium]|nr:hypothetical protein [Desulfobacteraceae bacterium]